MSGSFDTVEPGESKRNAARERTFELDATLVRYDDRPDRRTIYPGETSRFERMVEWISADADLFVALEDAQ